MASTGHQQEHSQDEEQKETNKVETGRRKQKTYGPPALRWSWPERTPWPSSSRETVPFFFVNFSSEFLTAPLSERSGRLELAERR